MSEYAAVISFEVLHMPKWWKARKKRFAYENNGKIVKRGEKKMQKTKEVKKIATKKNFQDKVFRVFHLNS